MRSILLGTLCFLSFVAAFAQQVNERPARPAAHDGGVRQVLESIVIPPIPSHPFSATLETEWVRYTGDGGTITMENRRPIVRDGTGRVYQERWMLVPKFGNIKSQMNWIQIADPKQHTLYSCNAARRVCELETYDPTAELAAAEPRKSIPNGIVVQDQLTIEELGTKTIAGVETVGRKESRTIDVGTMGNDQALTATNETWHSQELGINLLSIRTGPMVGKQNFAITELNVGEPDPTLFRVPSGYEIRDLRKSPRIAW